MDINKVGCRPLGARVTYSQAACEMFAMLKRSALSAGFSCPRYSDNGAGWDNENDGGLDKDNDAGWDDDDDDCKQCNVSKCQKVNY